MSTGMFPLPMVYEPCLFNNAGSICPIFIGNDGYIDTSEHEPDLKFDTALRVLQVGAFDSQSQLHLADILEPAD